LTAAEGVTIDAAAIKERVRQEKSAEATRGAGLGAA